MRQAPVVAYPLGAEPRWQGFVAALSAAATLSTVLWLLAWLGMETPLSIALSAPLAVAAAVQGWRMARVRPHILRWTGTQWELVDGDRVLDGVPTVMVDLDRWLLLRWRMEKADLWFPAARGASPAQWHGLRVALRAHAGERGSAAQPLA